MKTPKEVEELCRKLKPLIGSEADRLWYMYLAEDEAGRKELAMNIEIIAERLLKTNPLSDGQILLPPPSRESASGTFPIGDVIYNNKRLFPLYLRQEDFIRQIGIFAVTGEGKTNLAYLLALGLLRLNIPFMAIDWKRSWRNLLSLREHFPELNSIKVFTVGRDTVPFFWNPFRPPPLADRELWISTIADVLEKSHISGPGVTYYFNKIYSKLFKSFTGEFYPNFVDGIKELEAIKAHERELRWKQTAMRIFNSFTLGSALKTFNSRSPVKLEELLDTPVILELDLELPQPLRIFFSEMILRWIHLYRLSQGETDTLQHVLFLEEAHNLFSAPNTGNNIGSLENIYREVRAFGQGIVSITQHPSLLPVYLLGNCHTQIYLGLQHADDIRTARNSLFLKPSEEEYLSMLKVGECIIKIKNRINPCLLKIPLVPVKKGAVTDDWLKNNFFSATNSATKPVKRVKTSVNKWYLPIDKSIGTESKTPENPAVQETPRRAETPKARTRSASKDLLIDIFLNPFSGISERYRRLKLNPKIGNKFKKRLITEGYIKERKITTNRGWITLFDITNKGRAILRDFGYDVRDEKEGIIHRFWKAKISEYYRNMGLKVFVEEYINGRPDIIVLHDGRKVAFEIETGGSDIIHNVRKCLNAGMDEVVCVATSWQAEARIRQELKRENLLSDSRIKITSVMAFSVL